MAVENRIRTCLEKNCNVSLEECSEVCKKNDFAVGVAVSGGADSCCLLISLCNIFKEFKIPIKVISVNHFIRSDEETCGDVDFVRNLCEKLYDEGFDVSFYLKNLKRGAVKALADSRKMGIEEAARFLRYEAFNEFIESQNIIYLCLAHNKNDFYETVLMRFLQGASCDSFSGISYVRGKFIRPLLDVDRDEIELYLKNKQQNWCTDSTNFDNNYLRNKIRNKLMPFLTENFVGWKTAVEKGAIKAELDSEFINAYVDDIVINSEAADCFSVSYDTFINEKKSVQIRMLLKMCNMFSDKSRIPFIFLNEFCDCCKTVNYSSDLKTQKNLCEKHYADIMFFIKDSKVYVKKAESLITDYCFSDIIRETGVYEYDWGVLKVYADKPDSDLLVFDLKYKSGKSDRITGKLPYQLIVNHL